MPGRYQAIIRPCMSTSVVGSVSLIRGLNAGYLIPIDATVSLILSILCWRGSRALQRAISHGTVTAWPGSLSMSNLHQLENCWSPVFLYARARICAACSHSADIDTDSAIHGGIGPTCRSKSMWKRKRLYKYSAKLSVCARAQS